MEVETLFEISSRLVVNKAALKLKHPLVSDLIDNLSAAVGQKAS